MAKEIKSIFISFGLIWILCLTNYMPPANAQSSNLVFSDDFNGSTVDQTKWFANVNGNPGFGGKISVENGYLTLSSDGTSYPLITSESNPFPTTDNFYVEFKVQMAIHDLGGGFWVSQGSFLPDYEEKVNLNANILQFWIAGTTKISATLMEKAVYYNDNPNDLAGLDNLIVKLEYIDGTYIFSVNGAVIAKASSTLRPNVIGFGLPPLTYIPSSQPIIWSQVNVDYVKVYQEIPSTPTPIIPSDITSITNATGETPLVNDKIDIPYISIFGIIIACLILTALTTLVYRSIRKPKSELV
jgi:hypothetical protein